MSVITCVCRLRPLTRAQPKSMCVIRGRLTDRPVGVPRVVFGRATCACTYIGPLVSSAPSVITSSSLLFSSCPGWALTRPLVSPHRRVVARPPPGSAPSAEGRRSGGTVPAHFPFHFLLFFLCLRVLIGLCWPTYLSSVHVRNMFACVLYLRIALAAPLHSSRPSSAFRAARRPLVFLCASRR